MRFALQIVEGYKLQRIPSVVLTCGTQKYFFNAPETTQRFVREQGVKINAGSNIFLTQLSTNHITGMYGLLLTLYENKLGFGVKVYGPPGLTDYVDNIRFLMGYRLLQYSVLDLKSENQQKLLGIKTVEAFEKCLAEPKFNQIFYNMNSYLTEMQKESPKSVNDAASLINKEGTFKDENITIIPLMIIPEGGFALEKPTIAYICKSIKFAGKVHNDLLQALKIPKNKIGPLLSQGSLEIDGKIYTADQVRDPEHPSNVAVIIDCPSREYIKSLTQNKMFEHLYESNLDEKEELMKVVVHIGPNDVLLDPEYCEWMSKFPKTTEHIIVNPFCVNSTSIHEEEKSDSNIPNIDSDEYKHIVITNIVHKIFPQYLPQISKFAPQKPIDIEKAFTFLKNKEIPRNLYEYVIFPPKSGGWSPLNVRSVNIAMKEKLINLSKSERWLKYLHKFEKNKESPNFEDIALVKKLFEKSDPEVSFMGTGSMMPSQYRNVSAILLRFWQNQDFSILLDCGEGTYSQILNHFGQKQARNVLINLKVIFITHIHADHHLGMLQILTERSRILKEENLPEDPVYIVIPFNMTPWVDRFSKSIQTLSYKLIYNQHIDSNSDKINIMKDKMIKLDDHTNIGPGGLMLQSNIKPGNNEEDLEYYEDPNTAKSVKEFEDVSIQNSKTFQTFLKEKMQIKSFKSVLVDHCPQAYGVMIESESGWKLVYSGDTKYCENLIKECQGATILIHEATFLADLHMNAAEKCHSTTEDAIKTGMKMGAWRTILTHFSQRYSKGFAKEEKDSDKKMKVEKSEFELYQKNNSILALDHFGCKLSDLMLAPRASKCINNFVSELQFEALKLL